MKTAFLRSAPLLLAAALAACAGGGGGNKERPAAGGVDVARFHLGDPVARPRSDRRSTRPMANVRIPRLSAASAPSDPPVWMFFRLLPVEQIGLIASNRHPRAIRPELCADRRGVLRSCRPDLAESRHPSEFRIPTLGRHRLWEGRP